MRRILHITGGMNRAGAETMIMNIYRHIDRSQWQFDFVVYSSEKQDYEDEIVEMGGRVIHLPIRKGISMLKCIPMLRRLIKSEGPYTAIHIATLFNSMYALIACIGIPKLTRVVHSHSTQNTVQKSFLRCIYEKFAAFLIRKLGDRFVACGQEAGIYLFGRQFLKKGVILHNAVDVDTFYRPSSAETERLRSILAPHSDIVIGSIARLTEVKNHKKMLQIAEEFRKNHVRFTMLFIGDGELRSVIQAEIHRRGLDPFIKLLGIRSDIPQLLSVIDILLMPSFFEGNPVSVVEAQASGTPCILSDTITKGIDMGLNLLTYLDIDAEPRTWCEQILKVVKTAERPTLDVVNESFIKKGYSIDETVKTLVHIYQGRSE